MCRNALLLCYFNPRAPQGARHEADGSHKIVTQFQSTRSARSATRTDELIARGIRISIHALRKERDGYYEPYSGRFGISIHALRKERDVGLVSPSP